MDGAAACAVCGSTNASSSPAAARRRALFVFMVSLLLLAVRFLFSRMSVFAVQDCVQSAAEGLAPCTAVFTQLSVQGQPLAMQLA